MESTTKLIGELDFRDVKVKVYHDTTTDNIAYGHACFQARNPDSFYQGIVYLGEDGKVTYPEGAIIPKQTDRDREIIPKFIITGYTELSLETIDIITKYLKKQYKIRNNIIE